jgi:hypothetical protein
VKRDARPAAYPPPPEGLSAASAAIWTTLGPSRVKSPERRVLFEQGLRALDRVSAARAAITRDGLTLKNPDTGVMYAHPATRAEKDALFAVVAVWRALSLTWNQDIDGRI